MSRSRAHLEEAVFEQQPIFPEKNGDKEISHRIERPHEEEKYKVGDKVEVWLPEVEEASRECVVTGIRDWHVNIEIRYRLADGSEEIKPMTLFPRSAFEAAIKRAELAKQAERMIGGVFQIIERANPKEPVTINESTKAIIRSETLQALVRGEPIDEQLLKAVEGRLSIEHDIQFFEEEWLGDNSVEILRGYARKFNFSGAQEDAFIGYLRLHTGEIFEAVRKFSLQTRESAETCLTRVLKQEEEKFKKEEGIPVENASLEQTEDFLFSVIMSERDDKRVELEQARKSARKWFKEWQILTGQIEDEINLDDYEIDESIQRDSRWLEVYQSMEEAAQRAAEIQQELYPIMDISGSRAIIHTEIGVSTIEPRASTSQEGNIVTPEVSIESALPDHPLKRYRHSEKYWMLRQKYETEEDKDQALSNLFQKAQGKSREAIPSLVLALDVLSRRVLTDQETARQISSILLSKCRKEQNAEAGVAVYLIDSLGPSFIGISNEKLQSMAVEFRETASNLADLIMQVRLGLGSSEAKTEDEVYKKIWGIEKKLREMAGGVQKYTEEGVRGSLEYQKISNCLANSRFIGEKISILQDAAFGSNTSVNDETVFAIRLALNDLHEGRIQNLYIKDLAALHLPTWHKRDLFKLEIQNLNHVNVVESEEAFVVPTTYESKELVVEEDDIDLEVYPEEDDDEVVIEEGEREEPKEEDDIDLEVYREAHEHFERFLQNSYEYKTLLYWAETVREEDFPRFISILKEIELLNKDSASFLAKKLSAQEKKERFRVLAPELSEIVGELKIMEIVTLVTDHYFIDTARKILSHVDQQGATPLPRNPEVRMQLNNLGRVFKDLIEFNNPLEHDVDDVDYETSIFLWDAEEGIVDPPLTLKDLGLVFLPHRDSLEDARENKMMTWKFDLMLGFVPVTKVKLKIGKKQFLKDGTVKETFSRITIDNLESLREDLSYGRRESTVVIPLDEVGRSYESAPDDRTVLIDHEKESILPTQPIMRREEEQRSVQPFTTANFEEGSLEIEDEEETEHHLPDHDFLTADPNKSELTIEDEDDEQEEELTDKDISLLDEEKLPLVNTSEPSDFQSQYLEEPEINRLEAKLRQFQTNDDDQQRFAQSFRMSDQEIRSAFGKGVPLAHSKNPVESYQERINETQAEIDAIPWYRVDKTFKRSQLEKTLNLLIRLRDSHRTQEIEKEVNRQEVQNKTSKKRLQVARRIPRTYSQDPVESYQERINETQAEIDAIPWYRVFERSKQLKTLNLLTRLRDSHQREQQNNQQTQQKKGKRAA